MKKPVSVFVEIAAVLEALLESPPIAGVGARVTRDKQTPVIKENSYAINVKLDKSSGGSGGVTGSPTEWATDYLVECAARAAADQLPTEIVDPLLVAVWERLSQASTAPELLALDVEDLLPDPHIEWDLGEAATPQIVASISVRILHRTKPGQLVPWSRET